VRRVPAAEIEKVVIRAVREHLKLNDPIEDRQLIDTHIVRVEVQPEQLVIYLAQAEQHKRAADKGVLRIPWQKPPSKRRREILLTGPVPAQNARPIRSESRATLVAAIARGRRWLGELISDASATTESIAERQGCSVRKVNMTISLAFLAPDLVKAAIEGRLPHGMGLIRLCDLPAEWSRQHQALGLTPQ
jgi:site-specific DNA recombinase